VRSCHGRWISRAIQTRDHFVPTLLDCDASSIQANRDTFPLDDLANASEISSSSRVSSALLSAGWSPCCRNADTSARTPAQCSCLRYDEVLGQEVDAHHRRVGPIGDLVESGDGRNGSPSANIDEDLLRGETVFTDGHHVPRLKARVALITSQFGCSRRRFSAPSWTDAGSVLPRFHLFHIDGHSPPVRTPNSAARRATCANSALATRVFVGMQPVLMQVPPNNPRSMMATLRPAFASRIARNGPDCPVPMMIAS